MKILEFKPNNIGIEFKFDEPVPLPGPKKVYTYFLTWENIMEILLETRFKESE